MMLRDDSCQLMEHSGAGAGAQDDSAVLLTVASGPDLMVLCRQLMRVSEAW